MSGPAQKVPVPARTDINTGCSPLTSSEMMAMLGRPGDLTDSCSAITNDRLRAQIITDNVGPFRATGHRVAIASLHSIMLELKAAHPDTYEALRSEGMLCCRRIRGGGGYSNHSWGMALDVRCGDLDELGSKTCAAGLVDLYSIMHRHRWFWGAGFDRHDPMHFEPSSQLLAMWKRSMLI